MFADTPLVIIDMQVVFADPSSEAFVPDYASASAAVLRLLPKFEQRIVYTKFVAPTEPQGAWKAYYKRWPQLLRPATDAIWHITREFPIQDALVVSKHTFSKWGPELAAATKQTNKMLLAGVTTDCCVLSTALAAADAGVQVDVIVDACAGVSPAAHQQAINIMELHAPLINLVTVEDVIVAVAPHSSRRRPSV